MSLSNSRLAYGDCFELLDKALEETRGIRVEVIDLASANYLRMRIHHARTIDRRDNAITYPDRDHPMHGRSPYDILVVRIEEDSTSGWLYLDKQKVEIGRIEALEETRMIAAPPEVRMIEGPKPEREPMPVPASTPQPTMRR